MYSQRKWKYANNVFYWGREGAIQGNLIKNALLAEGQGWPGQRNCYATSQVAQESGVTSRQYGFSGFLEIYQDSLKTQLEVFHWSGYCFWRGAIELATFTLQSEVTWIGFFCSTVTCIYSTLLLTVWTAQVTLNLTFPHQIHTAFTCWTEYDTYQIFLNATQSNFGFILDLMKPNKKRENNKHGRQQLWS